MIKLSEIQLQKVNEAVDVLRRSPFVYLTIEMRCGKTPIALEICERLRANNVLFVTKKRVIADVISHHTEYNYTLTCTNYESLHKLERMVYDIIILDEAHCLGSFPRPAERAKQIRGISARKYILMSGTPTPESFSQIYHQMWACRLEKHRTFYQFASQYVKVEQKRYGNGATFNDYSNCSEQALVDYIGNNKVSLTQQEFGIPTRKDVRYMTVKMPVSETLSRNIKTGIINWQGKQYAILNVSQEMQAIHELCGGFFYANNEIIIVDDNKVKKLIDIISEYDKVCVFYYYKAELELLTRYLSDANLTHTTDYEKYKTGNYKVILLQTGSGSEGITLKDIDAIIYYSVSFSSKDMIQSNERATHITNNRVIDIVYLLSSTGFDSYILKVLRNKKKFTQSHYERYKLYNYEQRISKNQSLI